MVEEEDVAHAGTLATGTDGRHDPSADDPERPVLLVLPQRRTGPMLAAFEAGPTGRSPASVTRRIVRTSV